MRQLSHRSLTEVERETPPVARGIAPAQREFSAPVQPSGYQWRMALRQESLGKEEGV
jgi:hypothetical protein